MRLSMMLSLLLLAGCATSPVAEPEPVASIGQRLLAAESGGGQAGQVQPYELSRREVFRMPEPLHAPLPELPASASRQSLPPVTVCLNVVVDAQGQVQRGFPLLAHSQCGAGNDARNGALLQAAADAVRGWRFRPAAICRFAPGTSPVAEDCTGAAQVEAVPVTLPYAFTFEVVQGQAQVRMGKPPR
ncbi:conserved exported hypothetical protein [uncultured Stenotrophomonas sp.]|uniref:Lipoprotein n=1 Tax=uncultured Stenotrophomonas sp. TaxID=165438 RepID=A0A1Y5Q364_9GAMM|nr:conserved exported hypothetical protein [uncultured Stenotrophomonas sp.]